MVEELREQCQCDFQEDGIANAGFRCFPESPAAVTFRAKISESLSLSATQLVSVLEAWVSSGDMVLVQTQLLSVDNSCAAFISSFSEEECIRPSTPASGTNTTLVSVVVPVVIVLVIAAIAVLIALLVFRRRMKKKDKINSSASRV